VVATWSVAASSAYYHQQTQYYAGGIEPPGRWYAPAGDLGLVDAREVEPVLFERLLRGVDSTGKSLLTRKGGKLERSGAFDFTFSAPRSVSLLWAFSDAETKRLIERAQERAVRAALGILEREATFARRGKSGATIEKVALNAGLFRHGESRPAEHADGRVFGDPNLHHHAVCISLSTRPSDGTVGGLHSVIGRNSKMLAGVVYHAALANELDRLGFSIEATGRNGLFDVKGISESAIRYFSARNAEIEVELNKLGTARSTVIPCAEAMVEAYAQPMRALPLASATAVGLKITLRPPISASIEMSLFSPFKTFVMFMTVASVPLIVPSALLRTRNFILSPAATANSIGRPEDVAAAIRTSSP
jgi:conjugative relaxase-like TrwC/TraI family protein